MTFEITSPSFFDEVSVDEPSPLGQSRSIVHVDTLKQKPETLFQPKEICYESIERQRWEDEGGAHSSCLGPDDRLNRLDSSIVESHLNQAQVHFEEDDIDSAANELIAAAERINKHRAMIHNAMNQAISKLTTLGQKSTPPHPRALSLIKARKAYLL